MNGDEKMKSTEEKKRGEFRSRMGFIIACVGSAVGMGNIWMFPYRVGKFGGFAFLIPYFIFVILLGFSGVIGEMAFGRSVKSGPMGAFGAAMKMRFGEKSEKWGKIIGLIPVLGSLAMAIGYSVVVGWLIKYFWAALSGVLINVEDMGAYFGETAISFGSVPWHILALGVTFAVMVLGISNGIEKMNKIMMPLFFVFFIILLIRVATLAGAAEGYKYLFVPRWEQLGNIQTWVMPSDRRFSPCPWRAPEPSSTEAILKRTWTWFPARETWRFLTPSRRLYREWSLSRRCSPLALTWEAALRLCS